MRQVRGGEGRRVGRGASGEFFRNRKKCLEENRSAPKTKRKCYARESTDKDFFALCEGLNPVTGARLTQRLNTGRHDNGERRSNRRVFHDFTISPRKSVSIVALCEDRHFLGRGLAGHRW